MTVSASAGTRPAAFWPALVALYFMWGSTYLAIAEVVDEVPPLFGIGSRYIAGALIMCAWLLIFRGPSVFRRPKREYLRGALEGVMLVGVGNGLLSHAEKHVPTGVAALMVASMPVWVAVLRTITRDTPSIATRVGIGLGFIGLALLALTGGQTITGGDPLLRTIWSIALVCGTFSWAFGSFIGPRIADNRDGLVGALLQMAVGGTLMIVAGVITGEHNPLPFITEYSSSVWWGWLYLVFIGAIAGQTTFVWLLAHGPISLVATYAYVNPIVAVFLGWLLRDEPLTLFVALGGMIVITGVFLVITGERKKPLLTDQPAEHG